MVFVRRPFGVLDRSQRKTPPGRGSVPSDRRARVVEVSAPSDPVVWDKTVEAARARLPERVGVGRVIAGSGDALHDFEAGQEANFDRIPNLPSLLRELFADHLVSPLVAQICVIAAAKSTEKSRVVAKKCVDAVGAPVYGGFIKSAHAPRQSRRGF